MVRATVCIVCRETTTAGPRCPRCGGGRRTPQPPNPRRLASYQRARARLIAEHVRRFGPICPECGGRVIPGVRRTTLSADHITPLAEGGALLGPMRVCCLSCNAARGARVRRRPGGDLGRHKRATPARPMPSRAVTPALLSDQNGHRP